MELFGLLFAEIEPPVELVTLFVSTWIQETSRTRDEIQRSRLARLVRVGILRASFVFALFLLIITSRLQLSVFAASLIRHGSPVPFAIEELEAFALEHSRVREAAELFRLLKSGV